MTVPHRPAARRRYDDDLRLAHMLADGADGVTMDRFKSLDLRVETKPDHTPVTDADRRVEDAVRSTLSRVRSRDAVTGEERGSSGDAARRWVIDPIDGTASFLRGVPVWATLLALLDGGDVVVAVVSAPALGRRWWAARGAGAWGGKSLAKATPLRVSSVTRLDDASLAYSDLMEWEQHGRFRGFLEVYGAVWRRRGYGDFWSYALVAEGAVDIAAEPEVALHDLAAVSLVVEEAGGRFTGLDGSPGPHSGSALATNGHLHDEVLEMLARPGAAT